MNVQSEDSHGSGSDAISLAYGQAGAGVSGVTLTTSNGEKIIATVRTGSGRSGGQSVAAAVDRGSSRLPMAGAAVPLTVALDLACGMGGCGSGAAGRDTFVVVDDSAPAPGTPYTVVSTFIDGQPCWPSGPMGHHLPRRS